MKKLVWIVLLISLGANIGLMYRALSDRDAERASGRWDVDRGRWPRVRGEREWHRPGAAMLADSSGWTDRAEYRLGRLAARLGLEGEQREQFTAVHLDGAARIREQRLQLVEARSRLYDLFTAPDMDRVAVRAAADELAAQQGRIDNLVADILFEELTLLDADQRARYLDLMPWELGIGKADGLHRGRRPHDGPRGGGRQHDEHGEDRGRRGGP